MTEEEKTITSIYDLDLHETAFLNSKIAGFNVTWEITRVPSGWIYRRAGMSPVFVPFDSKFENY